MARKPAPKSEDSARNDETKPKSKRVPPPSPGRSPVAAKKEAAERYTHPDLIAGGLAKPGQEVPNVTKYGYVDVHDHYVNGPADLPHAAICRIWNIKPVTLLNWIKDYKWAEEREKRLGETLVTHGGNKATSAIETAREQYLAKESRILDMMLADIETTWKETHEERMSPTGDVKKVQKRAETRRTEVLTAKEVFAQARLSLGLRSKQGAFEGATITQNNLTFINESRPAVADTMSYLDETMLELMPPDGTDEVLEAEIMEDSDEN